MTTKSVGVNSLKVGSYIMIDGAACKISDIQVSRPGKHGHAKMRMEASGVIDGKKRVTVMPGHDHVDVPIIGKLTAQVLSVSGNIANLMDNETFETFDLEIPEDLKGQVQSGGTILYWQVLNDKVMKQVKTTEG